MKNLKGTNLINKQKSHCKNGHEFTDKNTHITKEGWRQCIECKKKSQRKHYKTLTIKEKEKLSKYHAKWRSNSQNKFREKLSHAKSYDKIREIIENAKNVPCMDCKKRYKHYVMDFDHRDKTEKILNVGLSRSIKKTLEEIKKCDVVCSNCHRIRTWSNVTRLKENDLQNL